MTKNKILELLINPLKIISNVFDISPDDENYPYTSSIFSLYYELFESIFNYNLYEPAVVGLLKEKGVSENYLKFIYVNDYFNNLSQLLANMLDMLPHYQEIASDIEIGSDAYIIKMNQKDIVDVSLKKIKKEILEKYPDSDKTSIDVICSYLVASIKVVIDAVFNQSDDNDTDEKDTIYVFNKKEENMRKSVNKLDKDCMKKKKKSHKNNSSEKEFRKECISTQMSIFKIVNSLNSMNYKKNLNMDSNQFIRKMRKKSVWFSKDNQSDEYAARCRFISYVLIWIIDVFDKIVNIQYAMTSDQKHHSDEIPDKLEIVKQISDYTIKMLHDYLNHGYSDAFIFFLNIQAYATPKEYKKKPNHITDQTYTLSSEISKFVLKEPDVSMDTIMKLVYLVCTNSPKSGGKIKFDDEYNFSDDGIEDKLYYLGKSIKREYNDNGISPIMKCYINSNPVVWSRWGDDISRKTELGILGMQFFATVSGYRPINRFIKELLVD